MNETFQIINEDCNTWEEEVSSPHKMSSGRKEKQQDCQHKDMRSDGRQLPDESLQTMNHDTTIHEEQVPCEH